MGNELVNEDVAKLHDDVGFLRAEVHNLLGKIDDLKESTVTEQRKVHDIVVAQSEAMRNLDRDMREIKPLFEDYRLKAAALNEAVELARDYRERKAELRGARALAVWLYGAAALTGGTVVAFIVKFFENWPSRPPHP